MKTILHVEDDALIIHVYRQALVRAGFQVQVAEDGLIASKMLYKSKPDLVLMDLLMPKLTGTDVIKYIRSTPALKSTPVIVLSNASITDLGMEAIALGVERVFLKSQCTPASLILSINELLSGNPPDDSKARTTES
jgi:CheY-like chemotaxis protein